MVEEADRGGGLERAHSRGQLLVILQFLVSRGFINCKEVKEKEGT